MPPRTPLLRPDRYFAERELNFFRVMAVVGLLIAAGPAVVYGAGWVLAAHLDGTVLVDNPERPPDVFCRDDASDSGVVADEDCEAPREIERDVDAVLWDVMDEFARTAALSYPLVLVIVTLLLHAGAWLADGDHGIFPTFAVAAWGMVPTLFLIPVALVGLSLALEPVTVSPGTPPEVAFDPLLTQLRAVEPYGAIGTTLTAAWGGIVWRFGLVHEQGMPGPEATTVAGLVAILTAAVGFV